MLDHNNIGSEGLKNLIQGLKKNPFLEELSVSYCQLDETASHYIQNLLMYVKSNLQKLNL